jgi:hypothetical protein
MRRLLHALLAVSASVPTTAVAQEVQWRAAGDTTGNVQRADFRASPSGVVRWRAAPPSPEVPRGALVTFGRPRPLEDDSPRIIRCKGEMVDEVSVLPDPDPDPAPTKPWSACVSPQSPGPACSAPAPTPAECAWGAGNACGGDADRFYFTGEYLLWWAKGQRVPPLVTTGPDEASGMNGILGQPGTVILFGGDTVSGGVRAGGRFTAGLWLDDEHALGLDASFFFLGQRSFHFIAGSDAFPVLARPFFSLNSGAESAEESTTPGRSVGSVTVEGPSRLWGIESNLNCQLCCGCLGRLNVLGGFRYLELDEGLHVTESLLALPGAGTFAGSRIGVSDRFDTVNRFYGGQAGLVYSMEWDRWSLDCRGKVALGDDHEVVTIGGNQVIVSPGGAVTTANGGLLALPSNSGRFSRDRFAVVPEVGATVGFQVTEWCRLTMGYSFLYWSSVVRPGDQIDRVIDVTQIPNFNVPGARPTGQARPAPTLHDTDYWAQGINFGVEFRY